MNREYEKAVWKSVIEPYMPVGFTKPPGQDTY
jgi:hypothetical protein